MMLKHYVEFYYPGSFFPETEVKEIPSRGVPTEIPDGCYAYRIYSRTEVNADGELLIGDRKDFSGMTYFGKVMTLDDIKDMGGDNRVLISNMECNGWDRVVRTRRGNFQPLKDGDVVLNG